MRVYFWTAWLLRLWITIRIALGEIRFLAAFLTSLAEFCHKTSEQIGRSGYDRSVCDFRKKIPSMLERSSKMQMLKLEGIYMKLNNVICKNQGPATKPELVNLK